MLVNEGSGWPRAPGWRAPHTAGTAKCVWHQTIISLEGCEAGAPRAILTAKQPAMSANKTRSPGSVPLPAPISSPGFGIWGFFSFCVVLPAGAFAALKKQQVKHPHTVYLVLPLGFPRLPCHFPTGLGSAAVFMG